MLPGTLNAPCITPRSLAVLLFDFPGSIGDYANCIGRTARPGQRGGRVYAFLPEGRFWIAGELIALLEPLGGMLVKQLKAVGRRFVYLPIHAYYNMVDLYGKWDDKYTIHESFQSVELWLVHLPPAEITGLVKG